MLFDDAFAIKACFGFLFVETSTFLNGQTADRPVFLFAFLSLSWYCISRTGSTITLLLSLSVHPEKLLLGFDGWEVGVDDAVVDEVFRGA